jgi:hypothetical protein
MSFDSKSFWIPDGTTSNSNAIIAKTGSGKTTWARETLKTALGSKDKSVKGFRMIYVSPKLENAFDKFPNSAVTSDISKVFKLLENNQIVTFLPTEPEHYNEQIDFLIESMFSLKEANPQINIGTRRNKILVPLSMQLFIDDAQIIDGFSNRKTPSSSVIKIIVGGRAKALSVTFCLHRINALPRLSAGNLSNIVVLSLSPIDSDVEKRIFGISYEPYYGELNNYRWLHTDLLADKTYQYEAIKITE